MNKKRGFLEVIADIEECVNRALVKPFQSNTKACFFDDEVRSRFELAMPQESDEELPSEYALRLMKERGFCHKNGKPNHEKFYEHAWISAEVWSDFRNNRRKPSESTLLKIIIGLSMDQAEAEKFLSLSGMAFSPVNPIHKYVLACIKLHYYEPELVCEILDFYIHAKPEEFKGYRNIYDFARV